MITGLVNCSAYKAIKDYLQRNFGADDADVRLQGYIFS